MAIATVDAQTIDMVGVTELNRLCLRVFSPCEVGGAGKNHGRIADTGCTQDCAHDRQTKERIGVTGKYLSHPNPLGQADIRAESPK
jgi:hypothetical protein